MKKTLALLALSTAIGLGGISAAFAEDAVAGTQPAIAGHEGGHHGERFKKADTNGDGYLTKEEMEAAQKERLDNMFTHVDTDKDGKLSQDELKQGKMEMRQKMRERFKERQEQGGGGKPAVQPEE